MGKTLHERITGRQKRADKRQAYGVPIHQQHQTKRYQTQHHKYCQGFFWTDIARRNRPEFAPIHMRIEITIGVIVDHATSSAHQHHTQGKNNHDEQIRLAVTGNPQSP